MIKFSFLLAFMACLSLYVQAQNSPEKEVAEAVESLRKAMVDADKSQLERLAAEDLSYGHSSGTIEDKATFVESLVSGKSDFVKMNLTDQEINVIENVALVRHKLTGDVLDSGIPGNVNLGVLLVWVNQEGQWKLLGRQAYKL